MGVGDERKASKGPAAPYGSAQVTKDGQRPGQPDEPAGQASNGAEQARAVAPPHAWTDSERGVRAALADEIREYLALTSDCEALAVRVMVAFAKQTVQAAHEQIQMVQSTLLARVLRDVRACDHRASTGYTVQAYTIVSSCLEAAYLMGFIGGRTDRATKWLQHPMNSTSPLWPVRQLIEPTLACLGMTAHGQSEQEAELRKLADIEYTRIYGHLCQAKHVHAAAERYRYWRPSPDGRGSILTLSPIYHPIVLREARAALCAAARLAATAIGVYWKVILAAQGEFGDEVMDLFERAGALLDRSREEWEALIAEQKRNL